MPTPINPIRQTTGISSKGLITTPIQTLSRPSVQQINRVDEKGLSPLFHAIHQGRCEVVQFLLQAGADPNDQISQQAGYTPLMKVASGFYKPAVAKALLLALLEAGADVDLLDSDGCSALHYAAYNRSSTIHTLLEFGADPRQTTRDGESALHLACDAGFYKGVDLLLKWDITRREELLNLQDSKGRRAEEKNLETTYSELFQQARCEIERYNLSGVIPNLKTGGPPKRL